MDVKNGAKSLPQQELPRDPGAHARSGENMWTGEYRSVGGENGFDEMEEADGAVRSHWQMFRMLLDDLGPRELERRWETAKQLIHDNGVTYNVYGDPAGMDRPWNLDALPLVYGAQDWGILEKGLTQRARLLDLLLADLYGPQRLIHEGLLPAELLFANPGFLRPLHGVKLPRDRWLHFYSADVARSPNGQLHVIGDRAQAPSGTGYTLENRLVISRALPDVFRDCRVQRLATFFRTVRETLKSLAPQNQENPRIVLLTPGPYNETYFEHAYLARYLGYLLVEGGDLTVRDNHVYLKTLGALQKVDVILRRQDDNFCDPLELRTDSTLGVAGLVQAVHAGNVVIANALGTGVLETPAMMMYLPSLARRLLDEDLLLPSVPTYWCGDEQGCKYVLNNLEHMVLKPTFGAGKSEPLFASMLTSDQVSELRARIIASPREFVGEEQLGLSTAPVFLNGAIERRHIVLRTHLVAAGDRDFSLMPGGLTRFSASAESMIVSMQRGGGSKDTWVTATGPVDTFSLLAPLNHPVDISRAGGDLASRVADNLYWLGRYIERAESLARLARGITSRLTDQSLEGSPELLILYQTLTRDFLHLQEEKTDMRPEEQLGRVLLDDRFKFGMQSTLDSIYRIASLVRDRMSVDTWRIINRVSQDFPPSRTPGISLEKIIPALDRLVITFAAFGGLAMESMTRGDAWRFLEMGRRVERSQSVLALLRGGLVYLSSRETAVIEALLEIADSSITYRRRYMTTLQCAPTLDLLLADESNPRSIAFQIDRLAEHLQALPGALPAQSPAAMLLHRSIMTLRAANFQRESAAVGNFRPDLDALLKSLSESLLQFSDMISQSYLTHSLTPRPVSLNATFTASNI